MFGPLNDTHFFSEPSILNVCFALHLLPPCNMLYVSSCNYLPFVSCFAFFLSAYSLGKNTGETRRKGFQKHENANSKQKMRILRNVREKSVSFIFRKITAVSHTTFNLIYFFLSCFQSSEEKRINYKKFANVGLCCRLFSCRTHGQACPDIK